MLMVFSSIKTVHLSGEVCMPKKAKSVKKTVKKEAPRNLVPVYVLVIMALSTVIVLILSHGPTGFFTTDRSANTDNSVSENGVKSTSSSGKVETENRIEDIHNGQVVDEIKKVRVYYLIYNDKNGKILPGPVVRNVKGENQLVLALGELAKGPTKDEENKGLINAVPDNFQVRSAVIRNGIAEIDCNEALTIDANGDIFTGRLNQIFYTAMQFSGVQGIVVRINGKLLKTAGGEGLVLSWPMKKPL
jgi:spore germination protein GerM